jgi:hypothetical protein
MKGLVHGILALLAVCFISVQIGEIFYDVFQDYRSAELGKEVPGQLVAHWE